MIKKLSFELTKARVRVILEFPFFASLLLKMKTSEQNVGTACTNGVELKVDPNYFTSLTEDERVGLLAHEVMHPALNHHTRRNGRHPKLWNYACDYVINPILVDFGVTLPKGGLLDRRFDGMSADAIYDILLKENPDVDKQWVPGSGFDGGMGDVSDFPMLGNDAETQLEEQQQIEKLISATNMAKMRGKTSASLERVVGDLLEPKVEWDVVLRRIMSEKAYDDYSWVKPNRRFMGTGFYLPSLESERYGEVAVAVDTSGSIRQHELDQYASDLCSIHELVKNTVHVIYCDSSVAGTDTFEAGDDIKLTLQGGGGTDFRPPFAWLEKESIMPKIMIYFTDGECSRFPETHPDYDTIWVVTTSINFNPPFGEVIRI